MYCRALERYMIDKLSAAERTYKELQLRMSDPDVAANATEFQKVCVIMCVCVWGGGREGRILTNTRSRQGLAAAAAAHCRSLSSNQ